MVSVEELRDQVRDALVALKAVVADAVPAGEVFFARDITGRAHVAGFCVTRGIDFLPEVTWEYVTGSNLSELANSCHCVRRPLNSLKLALGRMETALDSNRPEIPLWLDDEISLFSTFPAVYEAWERVYRLYFRRLVTDTGFLKYRSDLWGVSVSQLPSVGVCTLRHKHLAELEVFPNGTPAAIPWVGLPEDIAFELLSYPDRFTLVDVEGWPVDRVEVVSTLIREAGSQEEAFAAFKLAEQLVP